MVVKELKTLINECNKNNEDCFLEVDLEYPDELHDEHNLFPFCSQNDKKKK